MAKIPLTPVKSSNLAAIGFDGKEIHVKFHGGRVCVYCRNIEDKQGVQDLFDDFAAAPSKGKFFAVMIRNRWRPDETYIDDGEDAEPDNDDDTLSLA